ncbi:hypothetical protein CALVIDRAFT_38694 [Calocera viscosa TUFC12733]|uniref:Glycosyltransferase 61 catalytic domain-containing protein n=1 Tax=Calocera viscosa (strain TUFC12733) TaxID=1330018 RepID=A0A167P090_CALVF|nr:hypothetical protein CALVIDRAFT_38694 [Calocera viscosa TUFC12733]
MRRDVLLLSVATTGLLIIVWHSRSIWNADCPAPPLPQLISSLPQVTLHNETDDIEGKRKLAMSWLEWNGQSSIVAHGASHAAMAGLSSTSDGLRSSAIEATEMVLHTAGNTVFSNLYIYDGAVHIVTDNPAALPELKRITSNGASLNTGNSNPTKEDIRVLSVGEAETVFGGSAVVWEGISWMITEHPEFIAHYYHYTAEILLSLQRSTTALNLTLPPPVRLLFPHTAHAAFRDGPGMNAYVSLAAFPSSQLLFSDTWADMHATKRAYKLERAVIFDRAAAMSGPAHGASWKPISEAMSLPTVVEDWWGEVRERVVGFAGGQVLQPGSAEVRKRVVTYVSRQKGNRRALRREDHAALVNSLHEASEELGFELNVVELEGMSKAEQIALAARTTVLMGVHGNGLTSLVWMRPSPHSAVFEFFMPGGWFRDYEITARSLGIMYRGFWYDTSFSYPGFNGRDVEGFHSADIPVHALHVVAELRRALLYGLREHVLHDP